MTTEKNRCPHNPGSPEAVKLNCTCPVGENNSGQGNGWSDKWGNPYFWYDYNCPVHGGVNAEPAKDDAMCYPDKGVMQ